MKTKNIIYSIIIASSLIGIYILLTVETIPLPQAISPEVPNMSSQPVLNKIAAENISDSQERDAAPAPPAAEKEAMTADNAEPAKPAAAESSNKPAIKTVAQSVPFTSQAPTAEWGNKIFQDGCEEAASLMAAYWVKGIADITKEKAKSEIEEISKFEKSTYGIYEDTSARDTAERVLKGYFKISSWTVQDNITSNDIAKEVMAGNLVIVPMNGQALKNPYYTAPGPDRHMVLVKGYDPVKKEFITNDPGTKNGKDYRYAEVHFFDSIRDYPTGDRLAIKGISKTMIVVKPAK